MLHKKAHPQLAAEFHRGKFVVHKSNREFSALAIDQAHEQANTRDKIPELKLWTFTFAFFTPVFDISTASVWSLASEQ
jgi:hypothetical protein